MKRKFIYITIVAVAAIWVVGLGCWPLVVWSQLNCHHEDVDINSGRIRRQHYLLGLCVCETIEETSLSHLIMAETEKKPAEWRRVNTFSPLVHYSPHYKYHAAIYQISKVDQMWGSVPFTTAAKQRMAEDVLSLWQTGRGYFPVDDYLCKVESIHDKRLAGGEPIDVNELPAIESILKDWASKGSMADR